MKDEMKTERFVQLDKSSAFLKCQFHPWVIAYVGFKYTGIFLFNAFSLTIYTGG